MPHLLVTKALEGLFERLITPELIFFPVRHHSPACAWHLRQLIAQQAPAAVLVEGPESFTPLIPLILHPKTKTPVAVYTNFIDKNRTSASKPDSRLDFGPPRYAAYYPFCDYSPELVALRCGQKAGARLRFIDLNYPDQILTESRDETTAPRIDSLLQEQHLKRSEYLRRLAHKTGCRDQDDLWDHLFEARAHAMSTELFMREVVAYCYMARRDATPEGLKADGTLAREANMAGIIAEELTATKKAPNRGPVLVVTGGFHTCTLPALVQQAPARPKPAQVDAADTQTVLIRYSFEQLDSLNGYSAGMPAPAYYDRFWQQACGAPAPQTNKREPTKRAEPFLETASQLLVEIGRLTREREFAIALSTADEIAALEQARRLALVRGHPGPTREDLLDGVRSCFVKGAMDAEGAVLMGLVRHVLAGATIGEVPPDAGVPPIVEDFRVQARQLKLSIADSTPRKTALEIYRKTNHRKVSRLFHSLTFLEVKFAQLLAGPDFVRGTGLERIQEHWDYQWSPATESGLVEASVYGTSVQEATANRLLQAIAELEQQGKSRSAFEAVAMLIHACRMGLHRQTGKLLALIEANVAAEPRFTALVDALNQLVLLWHSREPLEAHHLPEIPVLIKAAYERACYLAQDLTQIPADELDHALGAFNTVRELLQLDTVGLLDPALFWQSLQTGYAQPACPVLLLGGAAGLLYGAGHLPEGALLRLVAGHLGGTGHDPAAKTSFLRGLLHTRRELAWRLPALLETVDQLFHAWSEEEFIQALPELRLSFANLTPRETDQVAGAVARLHGEKTLGPLVHYDVSEGELQGNLRLTQLVMEALKKDGLESWFESGAT